MNTNNTSVVRWSLLAGCIGMIVVVTACAGFAVGSNSDEMLRLKDDVVEVRNEDGDWVPVAGESTFELVGELEDIYPWTVGDTAFEIRETTQIEVDLEVGDVVRVRGVILEIGTWVAYSIEAAEGQTDPIVILIGIVDSVDPWVVNGITLTITDETNIEGGITPGMLVRVEILLLADGTWEVLSIAPLGDHTETPGCVTVIATVLRVEGNQIQFLGWPAPVTFEDDDQAEDNEENGNREENDEENEDEGDEDGDENEDEDAGDHENDGVTISADQVVQAVVCVSADGQIVIVQIIVLNTNADDDDGTSVDGEKVLVCHKPDKKGGHTISIAQPAVSAHLAHGDTLGPCP